MVKYDKLWETMKEKGITKYKLTHDYHISKALIHKLMYNQIVSMYTIDRLCNILDCNVEDVVTHYKEDENIQ